MSRFEKTIKRLRAGVYRGLAVGALFVVMLGAAETAPAANWYVDNAAGGANTGGSWPDAWPALTDVVWGKGGVKAGDTLFISGGGSSKQYFGTLTVGASGEPDAPITIRPGQDPGHSGTVIFNGNVSGCITVYDRSFITIDGSVNGAVQFVFQNGRLDVWNALVDAAGVRHFAVRYCEFRRATVGLNAAHCVASEFDHNYFHDIRGEAALRLNASAGEGPEGPGWWDSNRVHDNIFLADAPAGGSGLGIDHIQGSSALSIYSNTIEYQPGTNLGWQRPDGCQLSGRYNKIIGNRFINCPNAAVSMDLGGTQAGYIYIFNNIIECTIPSWTCPMMAWDVTVQTPGMAVDDVLFANNTIAGVNRAPNVAVHIWDPGISLTNWKIQNNIFFQSGEMNGGTVILVGNGAYEIGSDLVIDFNLLSDGGKGGNLISIRGGQFFNQANNRTGIPDFIVYEYRRAGNDYRLGQGDTAARGRGIPLEAYFNYDRDGAPRGESWNLGAYQQ